jgi:signal transduction histidine kinase
LPRNSVRASSPDEGACAGPPGRRHLALQIDHSDRAGARPGRGRNCRRHPERSTETQFELETPVFCDPARVAQLFSNLLGNAISHGAPDQAARVCATAKNGTFDLFVANSGKPIPAEARKRLFQPFYRGAAHGPSEGLGLGLYIATEIAKAHGGTLEVDSSDKETRFTFRMPLEGDGSLRPGQIAQVPPPPVRH